jgi:hypothetical protein
VVLTHRRVTQYRFYAELAGVPGADLDGLLVSGLAREAISRDAEARRT